MEVFLEAIIPLFIIILFGYFIGRLKILGMNSAKVLNAFVMKVPLPILIFGSIASTSFQKAFNWPFVVSFLLALFIPYFLILVFGWLYKKESLLKSSLRALASSMPNTAYLGIPLLGSLYGKQGILSASVATFLTVFLLMTTAVICELNHQEKTNVKSLLRELARIAIKNPLMIATMLGTLYSFISLPMPQPFLHFIDLLGGVSGPVALFSLGLLLVGQAVRKEVFEVSLVSIIKLIVQPLLAFFFFWLFQVDPFWKKTGVLLSALPSAVILAVFVDYYHCYLKPGLAIILVTTIFSIGTLLTLIEVFY